MITREKKIQELTNNELRWLIDNPQELDHVTSFFVNGGFTVYTDKAINDLYEKITK